MLVGLMIFCAAGAVFLIRLDAYTEFRELWANPGRGSVSQRLFRSTAPPLARRGPSVGGGVRSFLLLDAFQHARRQIVDAPEKAGESPHFFVGIKRAVGGHGGISDAVLDEPVHFRVRVLGADLC